MEREKSMVIPIIYQDNGLQILDQTQLPGASRYIELKTKEDVWEAIYKLRVRGAPAIGIAAAYGCYIALRGSEETEFDGFFREFLDVKEYLNSSRPTAVNLSWALNRLELRLLKERDRLAGREEASGEKLIPQMKAALLSEAEQIRREDESACRAMGEHGLSLLRPGMGILTHCNAGTLAASRYGTALSPLYVGQEKGYDFKVFADETRPLLQGARLTAWELSRAGIDVTLICDNMAATVMKNGWIDAVLVGCDRMAANGDGANKIGTSGVAILAKEFGIPFYMFLPTSTIDSGAADGSRIAIEQRPGREISDLWYEKPMAPEGIRKYNPAFDVTEAKYITAIITEKGIARPPYAESLRALLED